MVFYLLLKIGFNNLFFRDITRMLSYFRQVGEFTVNLPTSLRCTQQYNSKVYTYSYDGYSSRVTVKCILSMFVRCLLAACNANIVAVWWDSCIELELFDMMMQFLIYTWWRRRLSEPFSQLSSAFANSGIRLGFESVSCSEAATLPTAHGLQDECRTAIIFCRDQMISPEK